MYSDNYFYRSCCLIGECYRIKQVRIGAPLFMRTDPELALYGRYVMSTRLANSKFEFQYPELEPAFRDVYSQSRR